MAKLLEFLTVTAILAILVVAVSLTINPAEIIKWVRDFGQLLTSTPSLFLFGLCVGSFLNVVIDRLPRQQAGLPRSESIVRGKSHCPDCGHTLAWYDLIPLLSFVFLKGRCRYCQKKISWQYPLVELTTGILFASSPSFILYSLFLIPVFAIDLKHGLIPDKLVFPAILVALSVRALPAGRQVLAPTLVGSLVLYFAFCILHFAFQGKALGGGDVKLAFLIGLITGWPNIVVAVFSAFLTGAIVSVILMMLRKKKFGETVPFGPFLVLGTYMALFWGEKILGWYLGLL